MKKIFILFLMIVAFGGCDKDFEEVNVNPTKPLQLDPSTKFTFAQLHTSGEWYGSYLFYSVIQLMPNIQHLNITHYGPIFGYKPGKNLHFFWEAQYSKTIKNIVDLEAQLTESTAATAEVDLALVKIQKVLAFSRITDLWGDIPYSEAGKGFLEGNSFPKYDKQEDIYNNMLSSLESAVATLKSSENDGSFGNADVMYHGDKAKWIKFGNSLMLRLAMRLVKVDDAKANLWAQKAIDGGVMESNADIAFLQMEDHPNDQGPNVNQLTKCFSSRHENQIKISKTLMDFMKDRNDPRVSVLFSTVDGNTEFDLQEGQDIDNPVRGDENSKPNIHIFGGSGTIIYDAPFFFQTYAEVEFMLAEAAERWGLAGGDVEAHYNAGVTAAMTYLSMYGHGVGVTEDQINQYLIDNPFDAANALKMINEQYWVATFGNATETFSNWRRSGYPELVPFAVADELTGGVIPRRFVYIGSEKLSNSANTQEAADRIEGGDKNTSRVWWDK